MRFRIAGLAIAVAANSGVRGSMITTFANLPTPSWRRRCTPEVALVEV